MIFGRRAIGVGETAVIFSMMAIGDRRSVSMAGSTMGSDISDMAMKADAGKTGIFTTTQNE